MSYKVSPFFLSCSSVLAVALVILFMSTDKNTKCPEAHISNLRITPESAVGTHTALAPQQSPAWLRTLANYNNIMSWAHSAELRTVSYTVMGIKLSMTDTAVSAGMDYIANEFSNDVYNMRGLKLKAGDVVVDFGGNIGFFSST